MAIFVCYDRADKAWLARIKRALARPIRDGQIELWDDSCIDPGHRWLEEISAALGRAKVAVLLISQDFYDSRFIAEYELPRLLDAEVARGLTVLPVHVGFTNFHRDPTLSQFQAFNPDKPLKVHRPAQRERVLAELAEHILEIIASERRPSVVRVTDPESDDLREIWDLHDRLFPDDEVADSYEDLQTWISLVNEDNELPIQDRKLDDIMLALKRSSKVIGYLYAQHYIHRGIIFISYLGLDKDIREARIVGARELLMELIRHCEQSPVPWQAIVGEVEQFKGGSRRHAEKLFGVFRHDANKISPLLNNKGRLFKIDFNYEQPILQPDYLVYESEQNEKLMQTLLYFARNVDELRKDQCGKYELTKEQAINVFQTVLLGVYGDSYPDSPAYQDYLRRALASYAPRLEAGLRLLER